jgi:hypothetical protein
MIKFPEWVEEAVQRRYDHLEKSFDTNVRVQSLREDERQYFNALREALDSNKQFMILQWEEKNGYCEAIEKEMLYRQGVMDGARIIMSFLTTKQEFPSST